MDIKSEWLNTLTLFYRAGFKSMQFSMQIVYLMHVK